MTCATSPSWDICKIAPFCVRSSIGPENGMLRPTGRDCWAVGPRKANLQLSRFDQGVYEGETVGKVSTGRSGCGDVSVAKTDHVSAQKNLAGAHTRRVLAMGVAAVFVFCGIFATAAHAQVALDSVTSTSGDLTQAANTLTF